MRRRCGVAARRTSEFPAAREHNITAPMPEAPHLRTLFAAVSKPANLVRLAAAAPRHTRASTNAGTPSQRRQVLGDARPRRCR
eukprot:366024-Chlamydomonas_euryale.AAC.14